MFIILQICFKKNQKKNQMHIELYLFFLDIQMLHWNRNV